MIEAKIHTPWLQLVLVRAERFFGYRDCRAYMLSAIRIGKWDISYLAQLYRPGAWILPHTDGPRWTRTVAITLWQPKHGHLLVYGPHKTFLRRRIIIFNGADEHQVTECSGYRVSLLLQFARLK